MLIDGVEIFCEEDIYETVETDKNVLFSDFERRVLLYLIEGDTQSATQICQAEGVFVESVISAINEKSLDYFGDIILDTALKKIYDDYIEEVVELLHKEIK